MGDPIEFRISGYALTLRVDDAREIEIEQVCDRPPCAAQAAGARRRAPHPGLGERDYVLVPMEDLMHDPVRFLQHAGVDVLAPEDRVGHVLSDLGEVAWQH